MRYVGSKSKYAKELLKITLKDRAANQWYVEPFCGACSVIAKVTGPRIANDLNPHVIVLFEAIASGWIPPDNVSEEDYRAAKNSQNIDPITAFIGFGCSFSGKFFGGYARGGFTSKGEPRNYCSESKRNLLKQASGLAGINFSSVSYNSLAIPDNSIIYCDPPYANTVKYSTGDFDSLEFWRWCDGMVEMGHKVFVSEYEAPPHWELLWEKEVFNTLDKNTSSKRGIERLFSRTI